MFSFHHESMKMFTDKNHPQRKSSNNGPLQDIFMSERCDLLQQLDIITTISWTWVCNNNYQRSLCSTSHVLFFRRKSKCPKEMCDVKNHKFSLFEDYSRGEKKKKTQHKCSFNWLNRHPKTYRSSRLSMGIYTEWITFSRGFWRFFSDFLARHIDKKKKK